MPHGVLVTDYARDSLDPEREILFEVDAELLVPEPDTQEEFVELARGADAILTNWR